MRFKSFIPQEGGTEAQNRLEPRGGRSMSATGTSQVMRLGNRVGGVDDKEALQEMILASG